MIDNKELAQLRRGYSEKELDKKSVDKNPFEQVSVWLKEAIDSDLLEPNAMVLSTMSGTGGVSSRVVLLKGIEKGGFTFFTNYESRKGRELKTNGSAAILFFWRELGRQISIQGEVKEIDRGESENYFRSRPYENQIGAWASKQSEEIPDRNYLETKYEEYKEKFKKDVPLPDFWGGFRLYPSRIELWQGRESRLHDRIVYLKKGENWNIVRLSP
jgi:pyridoxamine 5'-phosphate oxidase